MNRVFNQLQIVMDKLLLNWFGFNKNKSAEVVSLVKLFIFVILGTHILACMWIKIGISGGAKGWIESNAPDFSVTKPWDLWVFSFYWILETVTTVGYGDYAGTNTDEYLFSMGLEFVGLSFFSFLIGSIGGMLSNSDKFDDLIDQKLEQLDLWMRRLEKANNSTKLPATLYNSIKKYIHDAFLHDFNLIIEEYDFYYHLPPKM